MRILTSALLIALVAGCGSGADEGAPDETRVEVTDAFVRVSPIPGRPAAAYFTLRADGPTRLAAVTSPWAERIELHDTLMEDGVARMGPLEDRTLPAGSAVAFEPGGKHAMLFGFDTSVKPGGTISLTFDFEGAADVTVDAPVQAAGGG